MSPDTPLTPEISGKTFPALRAFLRAYFHQDMNEEYGSLEEAARQFCEDADRDERRSVANEWERFVRQTSSLPLGEINRLLTENLGSACLLSSAEQIKALSEALRAPK